MATAYKELYNSVYSKIKDYDLVQLPEENADEILHDYIRPAVLKFECCDQNLADRDEVLEQFNMDLSDVNFEILTNFMVVEYLDSTYVRTTKMLKSYMGGTDFHKYDNANMLSRLLEVRNTYENKNKQLMINYSIRNKNSEFNQLTAEHSGYNPSKYSRFNQFSPCCHRRRCR